MRQTEPEVLSAGTLIGDDVVNPEGESLGTLEEIMIDLEAGAVAYAVVSFGGIMGFANKLFAFPWGALKVDQDRKVIVIDVDKDRLEDAPGFDRNDWPKTADRLFLDDLHAFYDIVPYYGAVNTRL